MAESTPPIRDYLQTNEDGLLVYPLTYDSEDSEDGDDLIGLGLGPHITPDGFRANGYDSRYNLAPLPGWLGGLGDVSLYAVVQLTGPCRHATRDVAVALGHATADQPKLELAVVADPSDSSQACMALRSYAGSVVRKYLNRPGWQFRLWAPEIVGSAAPSWQSLLWFDSTTLLLVGHAADTKSVLYRMDFATGEYTGRASSTTYRHIGSLAMDANGDVWATDNYTGGAGYSTFKLDLATSFSTGEITVSSGSMHYGLAANGGLAFVTVGGNEYVLLQEYSTSGTYYLYAFLSSALGSLLDAAARVKRFSLGWRVQDICIRASDGLLYTSRNVKQSGGSASGFIQSYDIAVALTSTPDGNALTPIYTCPHACQYAEGIDFHPITDRVWVSTEGLTAAGVSAERSHVAVWEGSIPQVAEDVEYLVDYKSGVVQVRLNGRLMHEFSHTPTVAPTRLSIGAPPNAAAGLANGFMTAGTVRAVALSTALFLPSAIESLYDDEGEIYMLSEVPLTVTNPDAASGTITGWTDELSPGTTIVRSTSPAPPGGASYYFSGTGAGNCRAKQNVALPGGLTEPWVRLDWDQASYDGSSDPGGCGVRARDSGGAELALLLGPEVIITPSQTWRHRSATFPLPAGTASVDVLQHRTHTLGTNVDCYITNVSLTVYSK